MTIPPRSESSIDKTDPIYRISNLLFLVFIIALFSLVIWFSKDQPDILKPRTLTVYAFSAMEPVLEQRIIPAFQDFWQESYHERVEFITTFAGSGVITHQIMAQLPVEVALLSSELDAWRLQAGGIISYDEYEVLQKRGPFCRTPLALFIRDTFQTPISSLDDLDFKTMDISIPDPLTSGVGQLAYLALYQSSIRRGISHEVSLDAIIKLRRSLRHQPTTSRSAMEEFRAGLGQISLNYAAVDHSHSDVVPKKKVIPKVAYLAEPTILPVKRNIKPGQEYLVNAFVDFLYGEVAQTALKNYGFSPLGSDLSPGFAVPTEMSIITLDSLGSLGKINRLIIDKLVSTN
ncbi:MAG: substrate-binding domain-containing protein [Candidatus Marinimicrobia bacterium]|nr:substrate-binding domain-containing protein [Candidatus Neomarinimicrobiota bacterium]